MKGLVTLLLQAVFPRQKLNSQTVSKRAVVLRTKGEHYDLQEIYHRVNNHYFGGKLHLNITWSGSRERPARRHRKLGVYQFEKKLIRIHRLLDQPHFPPYFISYVVYHEMLHSTCPPIRGRRGRFRIHHGDFREQEKKFAEYALAKQWEKENSRLFFMPQPLRGS